MGSLLITKALPQGLQALEMSRVAMSGVITEVVVVTVATCGTSWLADSSPGEDCGQRESISTRQSTLRPMQYRNKGNDIHGVVIAQSYNGLCSTVWPV